jgi:alkanesulfonate monooxygenase SsuD/methylene tetrahydromethanopterin reductase-like flavin-dependent oxidoreductase (luciferase family)
VLTVANTGFGVMLPSFDPFRQGPPPLATGARLVEELGFDSAWVGDHLQFYPPVLDALTALAGAATCTQRLVLGVGVLLLPMRHPVWTAKQVASIAALAPDRFILGVGVGGENPAEWEAARVPVAERGRRLDESLEIVGALLRGEAVDHPGPLLPVRSPMLEPIPTHPVPLVVGGRSEAGLRRAARVGDGWLGVWMSAKRLAETRAQLHEYCAEYGRPSIPVIQMVFVHVTDDVAAGEAEAFAFAKGQYGPAAEALGRWTLVGDAARVADGLAELRDAGAEGFVVVPAARDILEHYRRLAKVHALLQS